MASEDTISHIVWDWNGTLFADSAALIDCTIEAFTTAGLPPVTRPRYQLLHIQPIPLFYERLAGRTLSEEEQRRLADLFDSAYARRRASISLTHDAVAALALWRSSGRQQSLLSMHPYDTLVSLVGDAGIADYFVQIDGTDDNLAAEPKGPRLARHLERVGARPERVLMIGDSIGDAVAARECGCSCVLYHAGDHALHALDQLLDLGFPVVTSLEEAVAALVDGVPLPTCRSRDEPNTSVRQRIAREP